MQERNRWSRVRYGRLFWKKDPRFWRCLILVGIMVVFCLRLEHFAREHMVSVNPKNLVYTKELAGYLQVIPLSPEETKNLLLTEMGQYLKGEEVCQMIDFLQLGEAGEKIKEKFTGHRKDMVSVQTWCEIYEEILDLLGVKEQVQKISIQYLGMLRQEGRLIADNGNYDCDVDSIDFEYGKYYDVYISGRILLGKATHTSENMEKNKESDSQKREEELIEEKSLTQLLSIEIPKTVRVLITQMHPGKVSDTNVYVTCNGTYSISDADGNLVEERSANDILDCDSYMKANQVTELVISKDDSDRMSLTDKQGRILSGNYTGQFRVYQNDQEIFVVNEVALEDYLCGVVPGEMPESFEQEALKAQAVCARTYAVKQVQERKYDAYGAELTDSTACQVYLPAKINSKAEDAVRETYGQVLIYENELAEIYYFSTSCGLTNGMEVWKLSDTKNLKTVSLLQMSGMIPGETVSYEEFLKRKDLIAYDSESRFYRWVAKIFMEDVTKEILGLIQQEIQKNNGGVGIENLDGNGIASVQALGVFESMEVVCRNKAGTVIDLALQFSEGRVHLYHENVIRTLLGKITGSLEDKNGKKVHNMDMLPSASFHLEADAYGNLILYGGGLGHGIGMSQYGANGMAKEGMTYEGILQKFFLGTKIISLY